MKFVCSDIVILCVVIGPLNFVADLRFGYKATSDTIVTNRDVYKMDYMVTMTI